MAPKKLEDAMLSEKKVKFLLTLLDQEYDLTQPYALEDLEQILAIYGRKPQIAYGLAVAARVVGSSIPLAEEVYTEVVRQLLNTRLLREMAGERPYPLQRLVDFLGQHAPIEGVRGKVRAVLNVIVGECCTARFAYTNMECQEWPVPAIWALSRDGMESLARALLRYQLYDTLEAFVDKKIYEAIPALVEAIVEQAGEERYPHVEMLVWSGWGASDSFAHVSRFVGSDSRALKFLVDLSQAYIEEHGAHYPTEELQ